MFVFHLCTCMLGAFLFCFGVHDHLLYLVLMFCSYPIMPTCFSLSKQHVDVLCANQWTLSRKRILPWFSGCLLVIWVCNFANRLGRPIYLLGDLLYIPWKQIALIRVKWRRCRKQRRECACVSLTELERKSESQEQAQKWGTTVNQRHRYVLWWC